MSIYFKLHDTKEKMLVITDSVLTTPVSHKYTVLPVEDHVHCQRILRTFARRGVQLCTLRIDIRNQETLLAALDADMLARIVTEDGMIQVVSPVQNHYLIQHVGSLLMQMKQIQVVPYSTHEDLVTGCIERVLVRVCRYVPFASSIIHMLG
jgi:hypothetical protein